MFTSELSALAMLRWHEAFNATGGGGTGFLIGAMAAALLVLEYQCINRANAEYARRGVSEGMEIAPAQSASIAG